MAKKKRNLTITFIIPDDMRDGLEEATQHYKSNISWVIRRAIDQFLVNYKEK